MVPEPIPHFEGHPVIGSTVKMSGAMPQTELDDVVLGVDDVVQMISLFRCIGVQHKVDEKTGNLIRVHTLKPVEMVLYPTNPNEPDSAIVRAPRLRRPLELVEGGADDD